MKIRKTRITDIDGIAAVEFDRYAVRYAEHPEEKERFKQMLKQRIEVASDWMWVLCDKKEILGALSAQPTNKTMDEFESWEASTDNGTLRATYIPKGKNVYVVNLDVSKKATQQNGQYALMVRFASQVVARNKNIVFFESRMPDFRKFIQDTYGMKIWQGFSTEQKQKVAEEYSQKPSSSGKKLHDRLLNFYAESGFKFYKAIPNAFKDGESLDYGVICYARNPLPRILRMWPVRIGVSFIIRILGQNPKVLDWLIR